MAFVDENLDRLINQCENGDESISFLAIFSFLEGWLREKLNLPFSTNNKKFHFPQLIEELRKYERGIGCRELGPYTESEEKLLEKLEKYSGSNILNELGTKTTANRVRHSFSKINEGSLFVGVEMFIEFAKYHSFLTDSISNLGESKKITDSRRKIPIMPQEESVLYNSKDDLLSKYESCLKNRKTQEDVLTSINETENQIFQSIEKSESDKKILDLVKKLKEKKDQLYSVEKISKTLQDYEEYINELAISLIEARSKKNYENHVLHLSKQQINLIKDDIDGLTNKPGHSMYIKGGPGTGKTLVLIAILFKLYSTRKRTKLLTYYPTLNKYISYLFDLYNDQKLLSDLNILPLNERQLHTLRETGILTFDDFILPRIAIALGVELNNIKKIKDFKEPMMEIISQIEPDQRKAIKLYDEITTDIWPNLLTEPNYYTDKYSNEVYPKKQKKWEKIKEIIKQVDEKNLYSDLYAYYKFGLDQNIDEIALSNDLQDYILIDEAQDLTNAQIFAINKFVDSTGGLILAGDPSQEIRNKRISMGQLDVNIGGGKRYNPELTTNFRSSKLIQDLGNAYKKTPCLHIMKNTKSIDGITAGPPPQVFITDDTENTNYTKTFSQIAISVEMCINELCIPKDNICIVAFTEEDLINIQKELLTRNIESVLIYKEEKPFKKVENNEKPKVKLCTVNEIKGIDCAVLLFFISDQSIEKNYGGIVPELKANAIYTCITRAMYLLQVFIPRYCVFKDLSVAVLINNLVPNDDDIASFIEEHNKKERKGILVKEVFDENPQMTDSEIQDKIRLDLKNIYREVYGTDENCIIDFSEDLLVAYVYAEKKIVSEVQNKVLEISLSDALKEWPDAKIGDEKLLYIKPATLKTASKEKKNYNVDLMSNIEYNLNGKQVPERRKVIRVKKKSQPHKYKGKVFEKRQNILKINACEYESWLPYLPAPREENGDFFDNIEVGQIVKYIVSEKYGEKNKIAIIVDVE